MTMQRRLQVFLCHASQDKRKVRELNQRLVRESWIDPWLDEEKLLPGQDWDLEIQRAIRQADIIIVCLSQDSISKEGYVQKEFRRALSYAEEKPEGTTYIIPLRFDDCTPPSKFQQWQWVDYFAAHAWDKLFKSLQLRAEKLGISYKPEAKPSRISAASSTKLHPEPSGFTIGGRPFFMFGGLAFVKVAGGDFYMGADDIDVAKPQHLVYQLDYDFYVGRYPVTNQEYSLFLRETDQPIVTAKDRTKHPVVNVSWNQAHAYMAWLNGKYQAGLPMGYKFRLPSEAEWEKAARGVDGNEYPWGNRFDARRCNSIEGGMNGATSVGSYSPQGDSSFGAADMAGNVWEWTRSIGCINDSFFNYPYRPTDGRESEMMEEITERVLRGGSYNTESQAVRCATRVWSKSDVSAFDRGFRVAICPFEK